MHPYGIRIPTCLPSVEHAERLNKTMGYVQRTTVRLQRHGGKTYKRRNVRTNACDSVGRSHIQRIVFV